MGTGAGEIDAPVAARGQDDLVGAETVDGPVVEAPGHQADHRAVFHDKIEREILDEEVHLVLHALAVQRVQHGVAGAVRGGGGALGHALAEMAGHAAEGALIDFAVLGARERHAEMLQLVDRFRRVLAEILDGVLIAQPVRTLHRVVHVPAPIVLAHIAERRRDAALCGDRMAAGGEDLGHASGPEALGGTLQRRAKTRAARADDDDIERMLGDGISSHIGFRNQIVILSKETAHTAATRKAKP